MVVAAVAVDEVVAGAADERVGAVAAAEGVVAVAAVDRERGQRRDAVQCRDRVRAAEPEHDEALDRGRVEPRGAGANVLTSVPFGSDRDLSSAAVPL